MASDGWPGEDVESPLHGIIIAFLWICILSLSAAVTYLLFTT